MSEESRKPTGTRYWTWLIGFLLLLSSTSIVGWVSGMRARPLLVIATQVVPKERFHGDRFKTECEWLPNEEIIHIDSGKLYRYRLRYGVNIELKGLLDDKSWAADIQTSPDGKWLFWHKQTHVSGGVIFDRSLITNLDDGRTHEKYYAANQRWETDSQGLLGFNEISVDAKQVEIFDVRTNRIRQTIPVASDDPDEFSHIVVVEHNRLLEISEVTSSLPSSGKQQTIEISEFGLDKILHRIRKWAVHPPQGTTVEETRISPTGDWIAWIVDSARVPAWIPWLHRVIPRINATGQQRQELWISRIDGTEMREIGQAVVQNRNGNSLLISDLRWLPDGKRLSFRYDGALWTVPANQ